MKYTYNLIQTANQSFNTNIGANNFEFRLRSFRGITYVDLYINGVLEVAGVRAIPNRSLFSEAVRRIAGGVFMFECATDDYPYFTSFDGVSCKFVFIED